MLLQCFCRLPAAQHTELPARAWHVVFVCVCACLFSTDSKLRKEDRQPQHTLCILLQQHRSRNVINSCSASMRHRLILRLLQITSSTAAGGPHRPCAPAVERGCCWVVTQRGCWFVTVTSSTAAGGPLLLKIKPQKTLRGDGRTAGLLHSQNSSNTPTH